MTNLFLKLVEMSVSASWLVLAVLLLRLLLKRAPRWIHVALWALVAVRLLCPISLESTVSMIPADMTEQIVEAVDSGYYGDASIYSQGLPEYQIAVNSGIQPQIGDNNYHYVLTQPGDPTRPAYTSSVIWARIWIGGMILMSAYAAVSYFRLRRKVRASVVLDSGVRICDYIDTPFILGILQPRIYLPSSMEPGSASHVLAHERAHIARKDHWWKPLGYCLLTIHWFNPLLWLAYILLCRDIELACDEKVIRDMALPQKKAYSEALLNCSVRRMHIAACPLAFGEVGVNERVKTVLNYKKPAFWIVLVAILALIVTAVCFLTDPKTEEPENTEPVGESPYTWTSTAVSGDIQKAWAFPHAEATYSYTLEGSRLDELLQIINGIKESEIVEKTAEEIGESFWNYNSAVVYLYRTDGMTVWLRYLDGAVRIGVSTDADMWKTNSNWVIENESLTTWIENLAHGGTYMLSDENREEVRSLLRMERVQFFDPKEYGDMLFVGCAYDNGRSLGVACFEKVATGYKLRMLLRDADVKKCASGEDLYYCDYNNLRIFLVLNPSVTGMEWSGAYEMRYSCDTHPGLLVEYFPRNLGSMYRFHYGPNATTMYMDSDNRTHVKVPDYSADIFADPDDPYNVCTNIKQDQVDYILSTELVDADEGYYRAISDEVTAEESAQLLKLLNKLPGEVFEPAEFPAGNHKMLDIFFHNYTGQKEMTPALSLKLHENQVYYQFSYNGDDFGQCWKIESAELAEFIDSFFREDQSDWTRFAPVPKINGEISCDFDGMEVYMPKLAAFDYTVSQDGIRFKPEKEEGYILVQYCKTANDFDSAGVRTFSGIYGGLPGVQVYEGAEEIWSFTEVMVINPVWYVPKPEADQMPSMNVRLVNEDKASWVEEYSHEIYWILTSMRLHIVG